MDHSLQSSDPTKRESKVAVLIPCLNEEKTIGKVVRDFKLQLPEGMVFVFDNNSMDRTVEEATAAGAMVSKELRRGKGFVVQTIFQSIEADVYVMVDGDDTYPVEKVHDLIQPILDKQADMVVGSRTTSESDFYFLNRIGNMLYQKLINMLFGTSLTDILSGYRAFDRRIIKGLPLFVTGFEVEVELTIKALVRGFRIVDVPIKLRARPAGSHSKLHIWRDGWKILWTILALLWDYKPLTFFGAIGFVLILLGILFGLIPLVEYINTGLVLRFPTAMLSLGLILMGSFLIVAGIILHTINRRVQELEYFIDLLHKSERNHKPTR